MNQEYTPENIDDVVDTAPADENAGTEGTDVPKVKKTYEHEGQTLSQSAYIRVLFKQDMSRGDIAKKLDVPYYIVYSATTNMFNAAHPEGGEGVATHRGESITVTAVTRKFVKDAAAYVAECEAAGVEAEELINVNRPDFMRELVKGGASRGDVAKLLLNIHVSFSKAY